MRSRSMLSAGGRETADDSKGPSFRFPTSLTYSVTLTHSLSHTQPQSGRVTNTVEVRKAVFTQ